ncbi:unnamed protein product [Urochloa humidicola]
MDRLPPWVDSSDLNDPQFLTVISRNFLSLLPSALSRNFPLYRDSRARPRLLRASRSRLPRGPHLALDSSTLASPAPDPGTEDLEPIRSWQNQAAGRRGTGAGGAVGPRGGAGRAEERIRAAVRCGTASSGHWGLGSHGGAGQPNCRSSGQPRRWRGSAGSPNGGHGDTEERAAIAQVA